MIGYIIKRIFIFLPTLLFISLLAFGLSKCAPGDPVECILPEDNLDMGSTNIKTSSNYIAASKELGLDKPNFYFSLSPKAYPDTLYKILRPEIKSTLQNLIAQYGNWETISNYYTSIEQTEDHLNQLPDSLSKNLKVKIRKSLKLLYFSDKKNKIKNLLAQIKKTSNSDSSFNSQFETQLNLLNNNFTKVVNQATPAQLYIPSFRWYGFDNQYHNWLSSFVTGDFGISCSDQRPVATKIKEALYWTLIMNLVSIFLAYLISIPLGVFSGVKRNSRFDKISTITVFVLYSLPSFWIATLLVMFFTTPEYSMQWFPPIGLGELGSSAPFWARFWERTAHLILPVFCLTYASIAFIVRQMRGSVIDVYGQDYIRTAKAKGLNEKSVVWKHTFRNALFPLITLFASVFPAVLAGSVVIEVIFAIPGMGRTVVDSIFLRDWPMVYTVLMLAAILTMIGNLVADILYAIVDPRVRFAKD